VAQEVVIERRFRGPPDAGQGGYSCGLVAERIASDCATVTLRKPPPLERPLQIEQRDGTVTLSDGQTLIADGTAAALPMDIPGAPALDAAQRASKHPIWDEHIHPFPGCFGCGIARRQDEAVAISMGALENSDLMAGVWTPSADFAGPDGSVSKRFIWSALDCPTATGANLPLDGVSVLGRLTGCVRAPIVPHAEYTVLAWPISDDGRKHLGGTAIYAPDGRVCAYSAGLWIELRDPAAMRAKTAS
jgi:hypothetical protein